MDTQIVIMYIEAFIESDRRKWDHFVASPQIERYQNDYSQLFNILQTLLRRPPCTCPNLTLLDRVLFMTVCHPLYTADADANTLYTPCPGLQNARRLKRLL